MLAGVMAAGLRKYLQVLALGLQGHLAYRFNFLARVLFSLIPLTALLMGECVRECGLPEDVYQVATGALSPGEIAAPPVFQRKDQRFGAFVVEQSGARLVVVRRAFAAAGTEEAALFARGEHPAAERHAAAVAEETARQSQTAGAVRALRPRRQHRYAAGEAQRRQQRIEGEAGRAPKPGREPAQRRRLTRRRRGHRRPARSAP